MQDDLVAQASGVAWSVLQGRWQRCLLMSLCWHIQLGKGIKRMCTWCPQLVTQCKQSWTMQELPAVTQAYMMALVILVTAVLGSCCAHTAHMHAGLHLVPKPSFQGPLAQENDAALSLTPYAEVSTPPTCPTQGISAVGACQVQANAQYSFQ